MVQTFKTEITDEVRRRIVIDRLAWKLEDLKKGDVIEVTIKKLKT